MQLGMSVLVGGYRGDSYTSSAMGGGSRAGETPQKNGRMAFFCGFLIAVSVLKRVLGWSFISGQQIRSCAPAVWYRHIVQSQKVEKDLGYHRLSQLSKELQRAATPYFFIYSHSLLEARPELQPVGNVVEDSSHE